MVKRTITLTPNDYNENGSVKLSSILTIMQDGAIEDAEKFGAGHENLLKDNMFFAVYRNTLKFVETLPLFTKELVLITFQSSHDRMKFIRSYFLYEVGKEPEINNNFDPYENAVIYCHSVWVLMDVEKRCLLRATELKYPVDEYTLPYDRIPKIIKNDENSTHVGSFIGNNYLIDKNGHVNNAHYASIVSDFSTIETNIGFLDIIYEHEILPQTHVEVFSEKTSLGEKLFGVKKSEDEVCFYAEIN